MFTNQFGSDLVWWTWYNNRCYKTVHLNSSLIDLELDSRCKGSGKLKTSAPLITLSSQSIWMKVCTWDLVWWTLAGIGTFRNHFLSIFVRWLTPLNFILWNTLAVIQGHNYMRKQNLAHFLTNFWIWMKYSMLLWPSCLRDRTGSSQKGPEDTLTSSQDPIQKKKK